MKHKSVITIILLYSLTSARIEAITHSKVISRSSVLVSVYGEAGLYAMEVVVRYFLLLVTLTVVSAEQLNCSYSIELQHIVSNNTIPLTTVLSDYLAKTQLPASTHVFIAHTLSKLYLMAADDTLSTVTDVYAYDARLGGRGERLTSTATTDKLNRLFLIANASGGVGTATSYDLTRRHINSTKSNVVRVFNEDIDKCYSFVLASREIDTTRLRRTKRSIPFRAVTAFRELLSWYKKNKGNIKCGEVLNKWKKLYYKPGSERRSFIIIDNGKIDFIFGLDKEIINSRMEPRKRFFFTELISSIFDNNFKRTNAGNKQEIALKIKCILEKKLNMVIDLAKHTLVKVLESSGGPRRYHQ